MSLLRQLLFPIILACVPASALAQIAIEGKTDDIAWFVHHIDKISNQSADFRALWLEIENYKTGTKPRVTIRIDSRAAGYLFGTNQRSIMSLHAFDYGQANPGTPHFAYSPGAMGIKLCLTVGVFS